MKNNKSKLKIGDKLFTIPEILQQIMQPYYEITTMTIDADDKIEIASFFERIISSYEEVILENKADMMDLLIKVSKTKKKCH